MPSQFFDAGAIDSRPGAVEIARHRVKRRERQDAGKLPERAFELFHAVTQPAELEPNLLLVRRKVFRIERQGLPASLHRGSQLARGFKLADPGEQPALAAVAPGC